MQQVLSPLLRLGLHRLSVVEGPAATSSSGPLTGARPSALTCAPTTCVRGGVRGSGVEMLITEQDKFPGMTRGLTKPGAGRQSRGDSWVGVCSTPRTTYLLWFLHLKHFSNQSDSGYVGCSRGHAQSRV